MLLKNNRASSQANFAPLDKYKTDGLTETLNLLKFTNYNNLEDYLVKNINIFENESNSGCILLLYSAIFSRSIEQ